MRHIFCIFVAVLCAHDATGGVTLDNQLDPAGSAGLFVGVRKFTKDSSLVELPYAVDDAVDLAYAMSLNAPTRLLDPARIALALAGEPSKEISKLRLQELIRAGAALYDAQQSQIIRLLETQARATGAHGLLIVAFATHGINDGGVQYLLASTSVLQHLDTTLSESKLCEAIEDAGVQRSLVFIDACRRKLKKGPRAGPDPQSAAALLGIMARTYGHVVFSAAAAGDYAYDDDELCNGVFTAAVIDGLQCDAAKDRRGYVTVDTLSEYVGRRVLAWVRKHRNPEARKATQVQFEIQAKRMPLSACAGHARQSSETGLHRRRLGGVRRAIRPGATRHIAIRHTAKRTLTAEALHTAAGYVTGAHAVMHRLDHRLLELYGGGNEKHATIVGRGGSAYVPRRITGECELPCKSPCCHDSPLAFRRRPVRFARHHEQSAK